MVTKEETIAKLKELQKEVSGYTINSDISKAINICINYQNETGDYSTEAIYGNIYDEDIIGEYIEQRLKHLGFKQVARDLEGLKDDSSYYEIDDVYGGVTSIDANRLIVIIDDMVDALENTLE